MVTVALQDGDVLCDGDSDVLFEAIQRRAGRPRVLPSLATDAIAPTHDDTFATLLPGQAIDLVTLPRGNVLPDSLPKFVELSESVRQIEDHSSVGVISAPDSVQPATSSMAASSDTMSVSVALSSSNPAHRATSSSSAALPVPVTVTPDTATVLSVDSPAFASSGTLPNLISFVDSHGADRRSSPTLPESLANYATLPVFPTTSDSATLPISATVPSSSATMANFSASADSIHTLNFIDPFNSGVSLNLAASFHAELAATDHVSSDRISPDGASPDRVSPDDAASDRISPNSVSPNCVSHDDASSDSILPDQPLMTPATGYEQMLAADSHDLVRSSVTFECPVCLEECAPGAGVVLRECLHTFCKCVILHTTFGYISHTFCNMQVFVIFVSIFVLIF